MVEQNVKLKEWPEKKLDARLEHHWPEEEYAKLEHHFKLKGPCPVKVSFDEVPARVIVVNDPERPFAVNMNMNVHAKEPIQHVVCVKVCEPVCAKSDYAIGINMLKKQFAQVTVSGQTRIYNCPTPRQIALTCVNFKQYKPGMASETSIVIDEVTFTPLGGILKMEMEGDPAGVLKLGFETPGVRIEFPAPVRDVKITVSNYGSRELGFTVFCGGTAVASFSETIYHTSQQVALQQTGVTAVEIRGGSNEASIVEVCYVTEKKSEIVIVRGLS
jgi:hypothetical protein